ncbi:hypothetical protein H6P81_003593 [Aristolochia fimbriata]|uniref:NAC domain-containing protein n=1 Tax=Aristolochia fimbriata TaxID=158543 RepID=A0AAV7FG23_ARIFI|nr:hypothetical protein H6P81_003593 [Aristolochia fimbriata]
MHTRAAGSGGDQETRDYGLWPPGFRFYPTEEELVGFYLKHKLDKSMEEKLSRVIPVVDIFNGLDPSQLPSLSGEVCQGDDQEWFFFCPRQEREAQGGRPNRITPSGYWKATGSPSLVYSSTNRAIGVKKTMVFYQGRAPTGSKTKWKVNEYRALQPSPPADPNPNKVQINCEISLCRVYINSGSLRSFDRRPLLESDQVFRRANNINARRGKGKSETRSYSRGSNVNTNIGESSRATIPVGKERSSSNDDSSSSGDLAHDPGYADGSSNNLDLMNLDDILDSLYWDD